ncbi:MAG: C39 family peptidase, partial [Clostridiales bacterium]|nr:C39 family peptidase [Clostridiales bacterium]
SSIGEAGCGPTSLAIVVSSLTNQMIDPVQMCQWSYDNGYLCEGSGSYHSLIPEGGRHFGLTVEGCTIDEPQRIVDALSSGKLVVAIMGKGTFTTSGHFLVMRGVTANGKILVADPASKRKSEKEWDLQIFLNEARKGAAAGGPFWICSTNTEE